MNRRRHQGILVYGVIGLVLSTGVAVWKFYLFATFRNGQEIVEVQAGMGHFWSAVVFFVIACIVGVLCLRIFLFDDRVDRHA